MNFQGRRIPGGRPEPQQAVKGLNCERGGEEKKKRREEGEECVLERKHSGQESRVDRQERPLRNG